MVITSNIDVVLEIRDLIRKLPDTLLMHHHIKAHQDDHCECSELSFPAKLNCRIDAQYEHIWSTW